MKNSLDYVLKHRDSYRAVVDIISKSNGSLFIPSPATCFQDSTGATPCTVDSPVGKLLDIGPLGNHASQTTEGYKPVLRGKIKNYWKNTDMAGAVAGTPGTVPSNLDIFSTNYGITREIIGTGITADGEKYIDVRLYGTADSNRNLWVNNANAFAPVGAGLTYTVSAKVALLAGSWPTGVNVQIGEVNGSTWLDGDNTSIKTLVPGSTLTRVSHTRTLTQSSATIVKFYPINFTINNGETVDFTFRLACPQVELGSVANQFVPTTTSAAASSSYGPYWLDFDGSDDRLDLSQVPFQMTDDMAIVCGASNLSNASGRLIFSQGNSGAPLARLALQIGSTDYLQAGWIDDANFTSYVSGFTDDLSGKSFIAGLMKQSNLRYTKQNGVVSPNTSTAVMGSATFNQSKIGCYNSGAYFWKGGVYCLFLCKTILANDLKKLEKYAAKLIGISL